MIHRADSGFQSGLREDYCRSTEERRDAPLPATLLAQGKIRFGIASDINRLRLVLGAFMPRGDGVAAVGNILDLVGSRLIGLSVVRSWRHNDVTRHLRMGTFDLCPGRDETQFPVLKAFLSGVLEAVAAGNPYQEEKA